MTWRNVPRSRRPAGERTHEQPIAFRPGQGSRAPCAFPPGPLTDRFPLGQVGPVKHFTRPNERPPNEPSPPTCDRPLLLRLYASPIRTEIVRTIGYDTWDHFDGCDQLVPLMQRFGVEHTVTAAEELLASGVQQNGALLRLKDQVRQYAIGILGPPPPDDSPPRPFRCAPLAPQPAVPESQCAADYRRSDAPRSAVLERYRKSLWIYRQAWEPVANAALPIRPPFTPRCFDVVVHRADDEHHLITVRRRLSKKQRAQLQRWLAVLGPTWRAASVWPIVTKNGWIWERRWVDGSGDQATYPR